MKVRFFNVLVLVLVLSSISFSQFYLGAGVGFKSSGLKGITKSVSNGQTNTGNTVEDAGNTGFNGTIYVGDQIMPVGIYKLDLNLEISYSNFNYVETGYNNTNGSGSFSGGGYSGGKTTVLSFDILPLHRIAIPGFKLISPFAGIGLGLNYLITSDVTIGPPNQNGTLTGSSELKMGLLITYGALIQVTNMIAPFIQFKHIIPFGSETQVFQGYQPSGAASQSYSSFIEDVPGYFNLQAGCRITF